MPKLISQNATAPKGNGAEAAAQADDRREEEAETRADISAVTRRKSCNLLAGMEMKGAGAYLTDLQYYGPVGAPGPFDRLVLEDREYRYLYRRTMPVENPHNRCCCAANRRR
jgi:hypothetical protein